MNGKFSVFKFMSNYEIMKLTVCHCLTVQSVKEDVHNMSQVSAGGVHRLPDIRSWRSGRDGVEGGRGGWARPLPGLPCC